MTIIARHLHTLTTWLSRAAGVRAATAGTTFCDGCAQVCTADCRSNARIEQARTRALLFAPIGWPSGPPAAPTAYR